MSILARVEAIKAALGLPENIVGALPILGAATLAMGIELGECATLPTMVQALEEALGLQPAITAQASAAPAAPSSNRAAAPPAAATSAAGAAPTSASSSETRGERPAPSTTGGSSSDDFLPPSSASNQHSRF